MSEKDNSMERLMQSFRAYETQTLKNLYFAYPDAPEKREAIYRILTGERYLMLRDGKFLTLDEYQNLSLK